MNVWQLAEFLKGVSTWLRRVVCRRRGVGIRPSDVVAASGARSGKRASERQAMRDAQKSYNNCCDCLLHAREYVPHECLGGRSR